MKIGWLSPSGNFIEVKWGDHTAVADKILMKMDKFFEVGPSDDKLLNAGWVKITISLLGKKEQRVYWNNFLTTEQKNFLRPYFEENDLSVNKYEKMRFDKENNI